ncbi:MAG: hypothetical protein RL655_898, partial [Pseudomonadota bacterium]
MQSDVASKHIGWPVAWVVVNEW